MGSPLNHQRTCRDALPSPCFWVMWPSPEIWFLWLLLSGFPPKRAMALAAAACGGKAAPVGLSSFLQDPWEDCVHPVGCSHVPEEPLLLEEELGTVLSPWSGHTMTVCGQADVVCQHGRGLSACEFPWSPEPC